jgi:uncharacterized repeat protein (TIGR01451 family)
VSTAAAACRRKANRDRYDERGDTLLEILMTLIVLSIAVVALIVTFETGISASVDHRNLASNDVVLRQVEEQAFYQIQQQPTPLFTSCATNASNGPYSGITYNNLPSGYSVTLNSIQYWDTTASPAQFDGTCAVNSPQLISLTLGAPNGSIANTTFVVDNLGSGATSGLAITSCSLTPPPAAPTPCSAIQGTSNLAVYLVGTGFASGATVTFSGALGAITVNSTTFVTSTLLDLNVSVASSAQPTTYTITVTNPGGASASGALFTVTQVILTGMHVSSMAGSGFLGFLIGNIWPIAAVTVEDGSNHVLRHATVSGTWTPASGGGFTTTTCETDSSGTCYVLYGLFNFNPTAGPVTYTVTGVSDTGYTYVSGQDTPNPPKVTVTIP